MTIIWCLLECEPRSLTVYRHFAGICSNRLRSKTSSNLELCKHNCYPTRRCQIPKYTVPFTVTVVTSPLTPTLKTTRHNSVWRSGSKTPQHYMEGKLSVAGSGCFISGKKKISCWVDSTVMTLGLVWASCKREDNCPCREPKHGRPAHIWNIPDRDIMTAAMRAERVTLWRRMYQQFFQTYEWDEPALPTLHAYR
jgi:hypothetical protein